MTAPLDPRRFPYRDDIAADFLEGRVDAARYVAGSVHHVAAGNTAIRGKPDPASFATSEALHGEIFAVYDRDGEWCWGQLETDGYVGWIRADDLAPGGMEPTHWVSVAHSLRFPEPELKTPPLMALSMNARVRVVSSTVTRGLDFAILEDGSAIPAGHLAPWGDFAEDHAAIALEFLNVPYLWGGRSSLGIDCSGLVQIALAACGHASPRDTDMQADELGEALPLPKSGADVRRGDFLFWPGHVAIGLGDGEMVHATGAFMMVVREEIDPALERMRATGTPLTGLRRV